MTEEEATTKICCGSPYPGSAALLSAPGFTVADVAKIGRCAGSACMAWRWSEAKRSAAFLEAVQAHMQGMAKPNFNIAVQAVYAERGGQFERVEGYCGLAGAA